MTMVSFRRTRVTPQPPVKSSPEQNIRQTLNSLRAITGRLEHAVSDIEHLIDEKGPKDARHGENT